MQAVQARLGEYGRFALRSNERVEVPYEQVAARHQGVDLRLRQEAGGSTSAARLLHYN